MFARIPPLLARYGVSPSPALCLLADDTVDYAYYDAGKVGISLILPDATAVGGRLYWTLTAAALGLPAIDRAVAFARWQLPYLAGHEMGHHLRHHYGAYTGDRWLEEHVANATGLALAAQFPEFQAGRAEMAPLALAAPARLSLLGGPHITLGRRELEDALMAAGVVTPAELAAARHLARRAGVPALALLRATGLGAAALARAEAGQSEAARHLGDTYLTNLLEYAAFHLTWFADLLRQPELPDLGHVLEEYILAAGWEVQRRRTAMLFLQRTLAADNAVAPGAALILAQEMGSGATHLLLESLPGRPPAVQAAILQALVTLPPAPAAVATSRDILLTAGATDELQAAACAYLFRHCPAELAHLPGCSPVWRALVEISQPAPTVPGRADRADTASHLQVALQQAPVTTLATLRHALAVAPESWGGRLPGEWIAPLLAHPDPTVCTAALGLLAHGQVPWPADPAFAERVAACALTVSDGQRRAALAALARLPAAGRQQQLAGLLAATAAAARRAGCLARAAGDHVPPDSPLPGLLVQTRDGWVECGLDIAAALVADADQQAAVAAALDQDDDEGRAWVARLLGSALPDALQPVLAELLAAAAASPGDAGAAQAAGRTADRFWAEVAQLQDPLLQRAAVLVHEGGQDGGHAGGQVLAFGQVPLFQGLKARELLPLARRARQTFHRSGEQLFAAGDPGDSLLVLMEGRVELCFPGPDGPEMRTLAAPAAFGEAAVLDREPRPATARCRVDCRVLWLDTQTLEEFCLQEPRFLLRLGRHLARRLRQLPGHQVPHPGSGLAEKSAPGPAPASAAADHAFTPAEKLAHLAGLPLFGGYPATYLPEMLEAFITLDYRDGETIVAAGATERRLWIVARGSVLLRPESGQAPVLRLPSGSWFGEVSLLDGQPQPWTIAADGPCRLLALGETDLLRLGRRHPGVLLELVRAVSSLLPER